MLYQVKGDIFFSQGKYAWEVFKIFKMEACNASSTPLTINLKISKNDREKLSNPIVYQSLGAKLFYLSTIRLDLMFLVYLLSQYMTSPSKVHFGVAKSVLWYLKGTFNFNIWCKYLGEINLHSCCDNWLG